MSEFDKFNEWSAATIADLFLRWKEISEKCDASHKSVHRETLGQLAERLRELHVVHQRTCHLLALCQNADTVAAQGDIIALLVRQNESLCRTVARRSKHVDRLRSALDEARNRAESSTVSQTNANVQKALEPVVPGDREIWWPECFGGSTWTWPDGSHICKQESEHDEFCIWTPKELQTDFRGYPLVFETKEKAAKALFDLQCGPWHPRPASPHETNRDDTQTEVGITHSFRSLTSSDLKEFRNPVRPRDPSTGTFLLCGGCQKWRDVNQTLCNCQTPETASAPTPREGAPVEYIELNMLNYEEDQVSQLNEWGIWASGEIDRLTDRDAKLRSAVSRAGFGILETSGEWSIHDTTDRGRQYDDEMLEAVNRNVVQEIENTKLKRQIETLEEQLAAARASTTGDELKTPMALPDPEIRWDFNPPILLIAGLFCLSLAAILYVCWVAAQ